MADDPMTDDLRDEYAFDYRQAKPNRFAASLPSGGRVVYLEPKVAAVFRDSDAVNRVLLAVLEAMPTPPLVGDNSSP